MFNQILTRGMIIDRTSGPRPRADGELYGSEKSFSWGYEEPCGKVET